MSNEVKNTIAVLCKLINVLYETSLKPEHFRLAKFDKNEENVVEILWLSLRTILNERSAVDVKNRFNSLNYNRRQFYSLQIDSKSGSRELLLALIFIIGTLLERHLRENLESNPFPNFPTEPLSTTNFNETFDWKKLKDRDLENYRKWLVGHISSNYDMISEYNEQISRIQMKVGSRTTNVWILKPMIC